MSDKSWGNDMSNNVGYCKKQHSKDWRQHFKEFFIQLERRIDSIPDKEVSAVSIIRSYRQAANVVAHIVSPRFVTHGVVWLLR